MSGPRTAALDPVSGALVRFAAVGALTTLLDFAVFSGLVVGLGFEAGVANVASYSCGIVVSFLLNRFWTFHGRATEVRGAFGRFLTTHMVGLLISTAVVAGLATMLSDQVAKIASVPIVFAWNFAVSNRWVFR